MSTLRATNLKGGSAGSAPNLPDGAVVTGVVTATSFSGSGANLTGIDATALKDGGGTVRVQANTDGAVVTGTATATTFSGNITGVAATFSGAVSVGGTLTYEDVTNVDSVGMVTARNGIKVLAGGINAVGVVTATSFEGSGANLTNLPPAGNTIDLVADGAITAGKPVIIKTDGKVAELKETVTERTSQLSVPNVSSAGANMSEDSPFQTRKFSGVSFSETSSTGAFFFCDQSTNYLDCCVFNLNADGDLNKPSGSNVVVLSDTYSQITSCWEATNNKIVVAAKRDGDNKVWATWVSVATNTVTASGNTFELTGVPAEYPVCCDCGSGRVAVAYSVDWPGGSVFQPYLHMLSWNGSNNYVKGNQHTVIHSGGTSSNPSHHVDIAYHAANDKIIAVYHNEGNNVGCRIGTIVNTGSDMITSWGNQVIVASDAELPQVIVDVNTGKVVVTYVYTSNNQIYSKVGTISGTSISFGSEAQVDTTLDANEPSNFRPELIYLKNLKKVVYGYVTNYVGNYYTLTRTGTVSGTSISWANEFQHWAAGVGIRGIDMVDLNNSSTNKIAICGRNDSDSDRGKYKTAAFSSAVTNITDRNVIGFSNSAISDGATGTINIQGSIATGLSGLTPATIYYVQDNGTLATNVVSTQASVLALGSDKGMIQTRVR